MDKREEISLRLKSAADTLFGGVSGLAEIWGVQKEGIYSYFRGERMAGSELLSRLCAAGLNINWLLTGEGEMALAYDKRKGKTKSIQIPVVANVQCGVPSAEFTANADKNMEFDGIKGLLNPFGVIAQGLSMAQTILPGDILICSEPTGPINNHSICLVSFKTEPETNMGLIKRVEFNKDGTILLYSDNARNFPPTVYKENDIFRLYPVYTKFIRNLK